MRVSSVRSYQVKNVSPEAVRIQASFITANTSNPTVSPDTGVFVSSVVRTGVGVFDVTFKGSWRKTLSFSAQSSDADLPVTVTDVDKSAGVVEVTVHDRASPAAADDSTGVAVSLVMDVSDTSLDT